MRLAPALLAVALVVASGVFSVSAAAAELRASAPAGGGIGGVQVTLDTAKGALVVRRDGGAAREIAIPIDRTRIDAGASKLDVVPIGEGRRVVHAKVQDAGRNDLAFEAILSGAADGPIFAGLTGYTRGSDGDRSGEVVKIYDRDGGTKFVIVAEMREDTRICGQATTPLSARGLDPKTLELRGAALHRIEKESRDKAAEVTARLRPAGAKAPLARILLATGGSAPAASTLTDGNPDTSWSERRSGDGHGEFATMRAAPETPMHGLAITIAPAATRATSGAAPRTFFVATDSKLFHVTMPEDAWQKPGQAYEVAFPEPVRTTCVALVLDEAYATSASPEVTVAEVGALTKFDVDGASLDDVAKELSGTRAEEAAAVLRRAGEDGLAAVAPAYATLDPRGRALVVDVAASAGACEGRAASLLTRALADRDQEVRRRALGRLERCGKNATEALAKAIRDGEPAESAAAAPLLAAVAPSAALEPVSDRIGKGPTELRRALRSAFARAASSAPRERLLAMLTKADADRGARLDMLRALGPKLSELRPDSAAAIANLLRNEPDMATRYLVLAPLAHLGRAPGATPGELTRLAEIARRDPSWPVRAHAVVLSAGIGPLVPTILEATRDPEPRVREAALAAIASSRASSGAGAAARLLAEDPWTFVRAGAATALGTIPASTAVEDALGAALSDGSAKVRGAAIDALGRQRMTRLAKGVRERLDDTAEDVDVRALAARTLGAMCARDSVDRLTKLALLSRAPVDEADERIGTAAIDALAALHPADLAKRLAPLREKGVRPPVRRAAERALAEPGLCR